MPGRGVYCDRAVALQRRLRPLPFAYTMTDQRKALHDQVEQTRDTDVGRLVNLIERFLHPFESPAPQGIVFKLASPGSKAAAAIEEQRQQELARLKAEQLEMVRRFIGDAVTRLGVDLNKIGEGFSSSFSLGGQSGSFTCSWFEGRVFNRLGSFKLKEQQVVTFERGYISEAQPELIYKIHVLTRIADIDKELTVSL